MSVIHPFIPLLEELEIPGDFMELGVNDGDSFMRILHAAKDNSVERVCHAVDSFRGLPPPGLEDPQTYFKGKFDQGGPDRLIERILMAGFSPDGDEWEIWEGFVPDVLTAVPANALKPAWDGMLAMAFVDLDHCQPTRDALKWIWERLRVGGLLICDDYYPAVPRTGANKATEEFRQDHQQHLEFVMEANRRTTAWRRI